MTTDAMAVRTTSDALARSDGRLAAAKADVTRLRLGLVGSWRGIGTAGGPRLVPSLEVGLRHDGGDAETGFGLDLGGGLSLADARIGLSAEVRARGLVTHEADGFRDRGIAASLAWDPAPYSERGPSLTLSRTMGGSSTGGMDALLGRETLAGLAAGSHGGDLADRRIELKLGYGFGVFGGRLTATPEAGLGFSNAQRDMSLGWRMGFAGSEPVSMELGLTGTRFEGTGDHAPEPVHALMLLGRMSW